MKRIPLVVVFVLIVSILVQTTALASPIDGSTKLSGGAQAAPPAAKAAPEAWQVLAPGIDYQAYHLTDPRPVNIFVTRMDRSVVSATVDSSIATGSLLDGRETTSGMAARYDQAINYWNKTWGNRNQVVAAINGYYFDPTTGTPWRGQVHSGWYAQRFDNYENGSGFAWTMDGNAFIGGCVQHWPDNQYITYLAIDRTQKFQGINVPREVDTLTIYTPQYAEHTHTDASGVEVVVQLSRPKLIIPGGSAMVEGTIREIRNNQGSTPIPFDSIVLSAVGAARETVLGRARIGDKIGINQEITHYEADCKTVHPGDWTKTYASIGGDYYFLKNGVVNPSAKSDALVPNSRTAIAYSGAIGSGYIFFIVVDGWDLNDSEGLTIIELGNFAKNTLGASYAISEDSGGSSTMVVNGVVVNNPYCAMTWDCGMPDRASGVAPFTTPESGSFPSASHGDPALPTVSESAVANGMLMVSVEPIQLSNIYTDSQVVVTTAATEVRLGPGTNYAPHPDLPNIAASSALVIYPHPNHLNGVLAKGDFWWQVNYGGKIGWVKQSALRGTFTDLDHSILLPLVMRPPVGLRAAPAEPVVLPEIEDAPVESPLPLAAPELDIEKK